jgi:hypothetical protein
MACSLAIVITPIQVVVLLGRRVLRDAVLSRSMEPLKSSEVHAQLIGVSDRDRRRCREAVL